jgi:uncharacterized protein YlzI (FlbEa/FlbD family)
MVHIELVTGKKITVKGTLHDVVGTSGPIFRLTMVTFERVWNMDGKRYVVESEEQQIFLHEDKIVYMYESQ